MPRFVFVKHPAWWALGVFVRRVMAGGGMLTFAVGPFQIEIPYGEAARRLREMEAR